MGKKEETHARIVEHAAKALRSAGYDGVSVAEIMKDAGLTHGGFYAHFPSRDALVVEALERATEQSIANLESSEDLETFAARYLSDAHVKKPELGCALAALGSETRRQPRAVRALATKNTETMTTLIKDLIAGKDEDEARVLVSALVGAMVIARAVDDPKTSKSVRDAVERFAAKKSRKRER
jgi:AcrR family transcriptional regulator